MEQMIQGRMGIGPTLPAVREEAADEHLALPGLDETQLPIEMEDEDIDQL
jgi:hypothetical protein